MQGIFRKLTSLFGGKEDHEPTQPVTHTHWFAESGVLDLFFLLGPEPKDVFEQYALLTGALSFAGFGLWSRLFFVVKSWVAYPN